MFFNPHDLTLLTLLLMFAAVISLPFALSFAAVISQAVNEVKTNAEKLAGGDLSTRVQVQAHQQDEIGELARSFNMMADHLQEAFQRQIELEQTRRDLIAAVSHDLRTPLASVRVMSEALVDKVVTDPATVERYHRTIQAQVTSLAGLIDDLFELAKLDNAKLELKLEPGNMLDLISDTLEAMRVQAAAKNIRLDGRVEAEFPAVLMEESKIQRVLYNLIQNAIRHTPADGSIFITAAPTPAGVAVSVADTGEGIAEADLALIFNEFYRGEKSRNRSTGGAGLGLAIVKRIVEAHGGCVSVQSQVEQGTVFRFELPKWSPTMGGG
jgi:signal transduction histidine kinase